MRRVGLTGAVVVDVDLELLVDRRIRQRRRAQAHRNGPGGAKPEDARKATSRRGGDGGCRVADTEARAIQSNAAVDHGDAAGETMEHLQRRLNPRQRAVLGRDQRGRRRAVEGVDEGQIRLRLREGGKQQQGQAQQRALAEAIGMERHSALSTKGRAPNRDCSAAPDKGSAAWALPRVQPHDRAVLVRARPTVLRHADPVKPGAGTQPPSDGRDLVSMDKISVAAGVRPAERVAQRAVHPHHRRPPGASPRRCGADALSTCHRCQRALHHVRFFWAGSVRGSYAVCERC